MTLLDALRLRFPEREFALFTEVANGTGGRISGFADAIAMGLWPSRGLDLHGFELKAYRGDWLRELKRPAKAETFFTYCDRWWLVTHEGIVQPGELPRTWGHLEEKNGKLRVVVEAPKLKPKALSRPMVAAILRRASESIEKREKIAHEAGAKHALENGPGEFQRRLKNIEERAASLQERITTFEKESGVKISGWNYGDLGEVVRELLQARGARLKFDALAELERVASRVEALKDQLRDEIDYVKQVRAAGGALDAATEPEVAQ